MEYYALCMSEYRKVTIGSLFKWHCEVVML